MQLPEVTLPCMQQIVMLTCIMTLSALTEKYDSELVGGQNLSSYLCVSLPLGKHVLPLGKHV